MVEIYDPTAVFDEKSAYNHVPPMFQVQMHVVSRWYTRRPTHLSCSRTSHAITLLGDCAGVVTFTPSQKKSDVNIIGGFWGRNGTLKMHG